MKIDIENCWYYFLSLENDLEKASQYVEPRGQENVYSIEFYKIFVLACVEVETLFKGFCLLFENESAGEIGIYKGILLKHIPQIVDAEVFIKRCRTRLKPFAGWDSDALSWWTTFCGVKHDRGAKFTDATYHNAVSALSALYVLILYYANKTGASIPDQRSGYIVSEYSQAYFVVAPSKKLPGT